MHKYSKSLLSDRNYFSMRFFDDFSFQDTFQCFLWRLNSFHCDLFNFNIFKHIVLFRVSKTYLLY